MCLRVQVINTIVLYCIIDLTVPLYYRLVLHCMINLYIVFCCLLVYNYVLLLYYIMVWCRISLLALWVSIALLPSILGWADVYCSHVIWGVLML